MGWPESVLATAAKFQAAPVVPRGVFRFAVLLDGTKTISKPQ
jgi:hypothetical protein